MDAELLALSRACKIIEELEDARAQARVASFLMMRFTSAGEQNLPSEERAKHFKLALGDEADPRQMTLPGTDPATPDAAPTRPATATDTRPATPTATAPVAGADGPRAGRVGASDPGTDAVPSTRPLRIVRKEPTIGLSDDDEEVEVEI
jgi:hypothetical protein